MDARGDALFPRRYLDQFEKRISELYSCAELARGYAAQTMRQAVALLLDAADAHEQAAAAYELAGSNGHAADFQARAMRHRHAAAARRAAAAAVASRVPDRHDIDSAGSQAAICDGEPLGPPGPLQAGQGYLWVSRGKYPSPPSGGIRGFTSCHRTTPSIKRSVPGRRCYCPRACRARCNGEAGNYDHDRLRMPGMPTGAARQVSGARSAPVGSGRLLSRSGPVRPAARCRCGRRRRPRRCAAPGRACGTALRRSSSPSARR